MQFARGCFVQLIRLSQALILFLVCSVFPLVSIAANTINTTQSTFSIDFDFTYTAAVGFEDTYSIRSYRNNVLQSTYIINPGVRSFIVPSSGVYRYELWRYTCFEDPYDEGFDSCRDNSGTDEIRDTYTVNVALKPNVPGSIVFSNNDGGTDRNGRFTVNWGRPSASRQFTGYQLQQRLNSGSYQTIATINNQNTLSRTVPAGTGKLPSGSYSYRVRSFVRIGSAINYSNWRNSSSQIVNRVPDEVTTFTQPSGSTQAASFSVVWSPVTGAFDAVTRYELQCSVNGTGFTYNGCGSNNLGTNNLFSVNLPAGTQNSYRFRARACNGSGCGPWTASARQKLVSVNIPLPTPTNVRFTSIPEESEFGDFDLRWAADGTVTSYELQQDCLRGVDTCGADGFHNISLASTTSTIFSARGKTQDRYRYRVRACNGVSCSAWISTNYFDVHNLEGITPAVSVLPATTPGSMTYSANVNSQGDGVISIPFAPAPGVNGHTPNIGLVYSDARRRTRISESLPEDILGNGWRLSGFSEIRRCVVNRPNGTRIRLNNQDSLCLDGEPLVLVSGTHLRDGARYRTLRDSFRIIEFHDETSAFSGEDSWFSVLLPSGTTVEYGNTFQSQLRGDLSDTFGWTINKSTDVFGNEINYTYVVDRLEGINYPIEITYGNDGDARIEFEYGTRSDAPPQPLQLDETIALQILQRQLVLLHTAKVYLDDRLVREYRMVTEEEPANPGVEHFRRLQQIQECGYDINGNNQSCLSPLVLNWDEVGSGNDFDVRTGVEQITDGTGASTRFVHTLLTSNSNQGRFNERPFGEGILPPDVSEMQPIDGIYRCVVTELWRSNGLSSQWHKTTYDYQGVGLVSDRNWGFLGFYARRARDLEADVTTYRQYRMDFPFYTQLARVEQYQGTFITPTQTLNSIQLQHQSLVLTMPNDRTTYFPFVSQSINSIYEQNQFLGYRVSETSYQTEASDLGELIEEERSIQKVVVDGSIDESQTFWGEVLSISVNEVSRSSESVVDYGNQTNPWLIGFIESQTQSQFNGDTSTVPERSQSFIATRMLNTNRVQSFTSMLGDPDHELTANYEYDNFGNLTQQTIVGANVASRTSSLEDYIDGRYPGLVNNALSQSQTIEYDPRFGSVTFLMDVNDQSSFATYDQFGRITQSTDRFGVEATTSYDFCTPATCPVTGQMLASYRVTSDSSISPQTVQIFDSLDRLIQVRQESFDGGETVNLEYNYDELGRLFLETDPFFDGDQKPIYTYTFDIRNRITQALRPDSSTVLTQYLALPSEAAVRVSTIEDVLNSRGSFLESQRQDSVLHINGDLLQTIDAVGTAEEINTNFIYDGSGLLTEVMVNDDPSTVSTFDYDQLGNRTQVTGPNIGAVTNTYSAIGEILSQTDNKGQTINYQYDLLGRLLRQEDPDGIAAWSYDPANGAGLLGSRSYSKNDIEVFSETLSYNSFAQLRRVENRLTAGGLTRNYSTEYFYDSQGRLDSSRFPDGSLIDYGYNTAGSLDAISRAGQELKRYTEVNARGQVRQTVLGNGVVANSAYSDNTGRLDSEYIHKNHSAITDSFYNWKSNGNLEQRGRSQTIFSDIEESFQYDGLNRLTSVIDDGFGSGDQTFVYDKLGNIQRKLSSYIDDVSVDDYQYGEGNAGPNAVTSATINNVVHNLQYDANGAITRYDAAVGDDRFIAWNARQLATEITVGASANAALPTARDSFMYGPDGQRFYRESEWLDDATGELHTEKVFIISGYEDRLPANNPNYNRVQRLRVDDTIEIVSTTNHLGVIQQNIEYIHRDHLGSVEAVTDESGNILVSSGQFSFDAFGQRRNIGWMGGLNDIEQESLLEDLGVGTRRGFTDHEHLDRTGFIHANGRIYDPVLGRFLSPDPIVQAPSFSQNWNRYSYVFNNPLRFTDPSGFTISRSTIRDITEDDMRPPPFEGADAEIRSFLNQQLGFPLSLSDEQFDDNQDLSPNNGAGIRIANSVAISPFDAVGSFPSNSSTLADGLVGAVSVRSALSLVLNPVTAAILTGVFPNSTAGPESSQMFTAQSGFSALSEISELGDAEIALISGTIEATGLPQGEFLFRGDRSSRTPAIVFVTGFLPKGTNTDLIAHTRSNSVGSNFIATTRFPAIAAGFAGRNGFVFLIRTNRGIDVNSVLGSASRFPEQGEVAIPGAVFPQEIIGAFPLRRGRLTGAFIPNPVGVL